MYHNIRWTPQKISRRLAEIQGLVYHQRLPLSPFRLYRLEGPENSPLIAPGIDEFKLGNRSTAQLLGPAQAGFRVTDEIHRPWRVGEAMDR